MPPSNAAALWTASFGGCTGETLYNTFTHAIDVMLALEHQIVRFDAGTGKQLWMFTAGPMEVFSSLLASLPNGALLYGASNGYHYAATLLDGATGEPLWQLNLTLPEPQPYVRAIANSDVVILYVGPSSQADMLIGVSIATGRLLWRSAFSCPSIGLTQNCLTFAPLNGSTVLAAACPNRPNSTLSAIDLATGKVFFQRTLPWFVWSIQGTGDSRMVVSGAPPPGNRQFFIGTFDLENGYLLTLQSGLVPYTGISIDEKGRIFYITTTANVLDVC